MPSVRYLKKRLKTDSWNDILLRMEYSEEDLYISKYTDEELIKMLQDYYNETGQNPTISAITERGISHKTFCAHFGSFNNALIKAGLKINMEPSTVIHSDEELLEMYKDLCKKLGRGATSKEIDEYLPYSSDVFAVRFGGVQKLKELAGYPDTHIRSKKYTKKEIKNKLIEQYRLKGGRLANREISELSRKYDDFPSLSSILRYFKTTKMKKVWEEVEKDLKF